MKALLIYWLFLHLVIFSQNQKVVEPLPKDLRYSIQKRNPIRSSYQDSLKIFYIGNMGILIRYDSQQVLIDGLHKEYKKDYVFPSKGDVQKLISGNYYQNSNIDVALITHHHKDHFDASLLKEYLAKNEKSIAIGSQQVTDAIAVNSKKTKSPDRIKEIPYDDRIHTIEHNGIKIKVFKSPHVNTVRHGSVQNMAYIVEIQEYSILHVGDTNWDTARSSFKNQNLVNEKFDAIVLPYWMLLDKSSKNEILESITAKRIIATHIPPSLSEKDKRALLSNHSSIVLFTVQGEEIEL